MGVVGRRPLIIVSSYICVFSMVALGSLYSITEGEDPHTYVLTAKVPVLFLALFVVGYSIGLGPVTWILSAELLPLRGKGLLAGQACSFNWLCAFTVTLFFESVREAFKFSGLGWFFSTVTFVGALVVAFFLPETKGKTLESILLEMPGEDEVPAGFTKTSMSFKFRH